MSTYNAQTPFVDQDLSSLEKNNAAFARALELIPERPLSVVEAFGGIGSQSRVIAERWPGVPHTVFEQDYRCFQQLQMWHAGLMEVSAFTIECSPYRPLPMGKGDLLVADCNNFTLNPERVRDFDYVLDTGAEWIVLTDISRAKLHLNFRAYGLEEPDFDLYLAALGRRWRRSVLGYTAAPKALSYVVLGTRDTL